MNAFEIRRAASCGYVKIAVAALLGLSPAALLAQKPKTAAPAAKPAAPAASTPATPAAGAAAAPAAGRGTTAAPAAAGRGTAAPAAPGRGTAAATSGRGTAAPAAAPGQHSAVAAPHPSASAPPHANPAHSGETTTHGANGEVTRGPNGDIRRVHVNGMDIHHGPGGSRIVERERADHSRVVTDRFGHGYVQRPYSYRGAVFVHRTYYVNGIAYGRVYRPYVFGGIAMNVYAPGFYYVPAFYGWAYNPWAAPIAFGWGWAGSPWYGYYGAYFTPYPVYASPSLWLTDYLVAQTLQAAYMARAAELANQQANFTPMTPDVKQQIADEVRRQIALENAEAGAGAQVAPDPASSGIARMLGDNTAHVFVVSAGLNVPSNAGECAVTEGDVLQLRPGTPPNAPAASLMVLASKGQDCRKGATVTVGVADLQDMQNHMRETLDQGLADLQKKQGQNGIPAAPASAVAPPVQTAFAAIAPPPDPNVASELSAQAKEAEQAEQEALQPGPGGPYVGPNPEPVAPAPAPAAKTPLTLGQSTEEVIAILGQPVNIVDLGTKKIYVFKDLKVTFTAGKASAFQ